VVAPSEVGLCLMHMRGDPATMQRETGYADLCGEIRDYLAARLAAAQAAGIAAERICLDPGIGFGKSAAQNLELIDRLDTFAALGRPLLVGVSRKSFIGAVCGEENARQRLPGTIAALTWAVARGAAIVRVHDVAACRQAARLAEALKSRMAA
jgi:dihydropteroate synthase